MTCLLPSLEDMYPKRGDVRAVVREYITDVTGRLRFEMCLQGVRTGEVRDVDIYPGWQLRSCSIRRVNHVDNDGRRLLFIPPRVRLARDAVEELWPKHFEVGAILNVHNISFEANYDFKGMTTTRVSFYGKVDIVRLQVLIGKSEGPSHVPFLKMFLVREIGPLDFGGPDSSGVRDVGILKDATERLVRQCIVDTMTTRVAPLMTDVLRAIPFPTVANGQE